MLHTSERELFESQARDNLLTDLNESYNAKQGKAWGFFHEESGAYPLSGWLRAYLDNTQDFIGFTWQATEHLQKLMEETNLSVGGHVFIAHYQQGMTDYLVIALLHHSEGVAVSAALDVSPVKHLTLASCTWPPASTSANGATTRSLASTFPSSRARTAAGSTTTSATLLAVRKVSTPPAKPAPC